MAKKEQKELTVEEKLQLLYQLQTTLSGIDEKRTLRGELPEEVKGLEDELVGLSTRIEKIQAEITEYNKAIRLKQGEIEKATMRSEQYKSQLYDVRNNRQYDSLTKEIEFLDLEILACKKKIREAEQHIDDLTRSLNDNTDLIDERRKDLDEKKGELTDIIAETRVEEDKLKDKARELEAKIDPRLLYSFKRIRKNARNGLGIVYVQRDSCGGCFNKIPPQRQLDIMMHKKIIPCEYCGRILIDPELAGVKLDSKTEDKPKRKRAIRRTKKTTEE